MPFLYLFTGHRYTICKPTEACHLVLLHVWKHEYISYSVTLIKPLEDPRTKSPDWLQWWIHRKGPPPLNFRPNWGQKKWFWDHPPYLRVWMTAAPPPHPPPPHPLIWRSGSATGLISVHFIQVYVERSKYVLFGDHFIYSFNLSTWVCYIHYQRRIE